uniref:Uncharacterized protein n=1 Tax=Anguilla anguilla TaxID=7936 RepID=A0A0E9XRC8_ANGAN
MERRQEYDHLWKTFLMILTKKEKVLNRQCR